MSLSASSKKVKLTGKVKDVDRNWYKTVKIGDQWWMAENLKTTKYRNHDLIGTTDPYNKDISEETYAKYQWAYNGIESSVAIYGRLYTWYAVTDSRKICPNSWHVPSDAEWTTLTTFLGGESIAGSKLKETGFEHWYFLSSEYLGGTNESGFTALPSGVRNRYGDFNQLRFGGEYWSSTAETTSPNAIFRLLGFNSDEVIIADAGFLEALAVRCIRD